jgi:hypothetical protein
MNRAMSRESKSRSKSIRNSIKLNFKKLPEDWFSPKGNQTNTHNYQNTQHNSPQTEKYIYLPPS